MVTACGASTSTTSNPASTSAATSSGSAQPLTKLKVAYDGFSMSTGPLNYAYQKGIFKKYGLDLELTFISAGATLTQATVGGSVDIAQNGYSPAAEAMVAGADLAFIGGIANKLPFQMVVKSNITDANSLKGKKIAISKFGSSTDQAADIALTSLGLKKTDVAILQLGGAGERMAADLSGQVDGSMEQYPQTGELLKKGFRVMVDVTDVAGEYPNTAYVAKRDFIAKNPEVIKKFMMAISEGIYEYKKNKDEAVKLTAAFLKMDNPQELNDTYDFYVNKIYPEIPRPSLKGIDLVLQQISKDNPKAKDYKTEKLVDTTALDALEKEGFFKNLLK